jgi:signal transduction histidine kinase/AmiR/NasT family two-component response regulator
MENKAKILYVEDNPLNKALTRTILEQQGYEVFEASDGSSGINLARTAQPDLVLMDINMPGLDGYETATRLKGLPSMSQVPVIAFTAKVVSKVEHKRMLAAGCDGYIPKTATPKELTIQVAAYLRGKREKLAAADRDAGARDYQQHLVSHLDIQISKLTRANEQLTLINNVAQAISSTLNLDELLTLITTQVEKTLEVEGCSVLLLDEHSGELIFKAASGQNATHVVGLRLEPGQGIAGWVAQGGQAVFINDVRNDARFYPDIDQIFKLYTRSIICVPLKMKGKIIGIIEAVNKLKGEFDQDSLQLLDSLASTAALAIENARLYSDLQAERDQLVHQEEEVRRSIARDLHDGPTQIVSAMAMNVEFIKKLRVKAPEQVDQELDHLQTMANEAAHDIRNLLFGLHPTILETQGLEAALHVYVERFSQRNSLDLRLDIPPDLRLQLTREAEIVAFIIIQEAVNNAKKHAEASQVVIKFRQNDKLVAIIVQDDGKGFDVQQVSQGYDQRVSFGLMTMPERARLINAEFKLRSKPGQGTSVILALPGQAPAPPPDLVAARLKNF